MNENPPVVSLKFSAESWKLEWREKESCALSFTKLKKAIEGFRGRAELMKDQNPVVAVTLRYVDFVDVCEEFIKPRAA